MMSEDIGECRLDTGLTKRRSMRLFRQKPFLKGIVVLLVAGVFVALIAMALWDYHLSGQQSHQELLTPVWAVLVTTRDHYERYSLEWNHQTWELRQAGKVVCLGSTSTGSSECLHCDGACNHTTVQKVLTCMSMSNSPEAFNVSLDGSFIALSSSEATIVPLSSLPEGCAEAPSKAKFKTSEVPLFPNYDVVGKGYDSICGDLMAPTGDKGFKFAVIDLGTMYVDSPDQRYRLPNTINVQAYPTCEGNVETKEWQGAEQYQSGIAVSLSVSAKDLSPVYAFSGTASTELLYNSAFAFGDTSMVSQSQCMVYNVKILPTFTLTQTFRSAILGMTSASAAKNVVQNFGTSYVAESSMGSKAIEISTFSASTRITVESQALSAGAEASYRVTANVATSLQMSKAKDYRSSRTSYIWAHSGAPFQSDVTLWLSATKAEPSPISIVVRSLASLITPDFFPTLTSTGISSRVKLLGAAIAEYERSKGRDLSDKILRVYATQYPNQGTTTIVGCPADAPTLLSCGYIVPPGTPREKFLRSVPVLSDGVYKCECYSYFGLKCVPVCASVPSPPSSPIRFAASEKDMRVSCPANHKVTGCHIKPMDYGNWESYRSAYPLTDGSGCQCYDWFGANCIATCFPSAAFQSGEVKVLSKIIAPGAMNNEADGVSCGTTMQAIGCGVEKTRSGGSESQPRAYVDVSFNGCKCYDFYGTTCYTICARMKI